MAALLSLGAVALASAAVFALEPVAPVLSLGVLYLFAVLPVAAIWGLPFAIPVSIVSMLAFNWLFLPPTHTLRLADSENWVALAVYLVTAISVSGLSARARRRAEEAEQRRREATLAADVSSLLLEGVEVEPCLETIATRAARLLGAAHGRIELDPGAASDLGEAGIELRANDRVVGWLFLDTTGRAIPRSQHESARCSHRSSPLRSTANGWPAKPVRARHSVSATHSKRKRFATATP